MIYYNKEIKLSRVLLAGYKVFFDVSHPLSQHNGSVYYHRHLASLKSGRWLTKKDHVHHIDENKLNNSLDNILVSTASEHARLHKPRKIYYCGVCNNETYNKYYCSVKCVNIGRRKVAERPSKKELKSLIKNNSWRSIGRMHGVSDNAIRKWARAYGII